MAHRWEEIIRLARALERAGTENRPIDPAKALRLARVVIEFQDDMLGKPTDKPSQPASATTQTTPRTA